MGSGATDTPAPEAISHASFCALAEPIPWSRNDTIQTVTAVKEHNAVGKTLCGWGQSAGKTSP